MNVVRLLVLGAIREGGASYGYAIQQTLDDWQVRTWTRLHSGSVYHALQQMTKEGLLAVDAQQPGNRGPGKTLFTLTAMGEAEFLSQLREALASFDLIELSAGVAFVDCLPATEARERLGATIARLNQNVARLGAIASGAPQGAGPPRTRDLLELWRANLAATADSLGHIDIVGPHD
ncbi:MULTISPECIES: PadR family transcriptional regulator [unclassified Devosia]|uniref:PadR family transcriptional regulator n=1 Tax=unclassified Devosia TaxID=196773 RepID=UPI00086DFD3B|nr:MULTISPECIES: PadR family transcriptional regulator [unclassified Devosia]MBN9360076.1 PadR family transcriptional regulator [Devosia sp.]ODS86712.1 MAG: hypothetical protein ABS47_13645 [Devosia sp. SCN 66-27]OJX22131.1 MAG: hypothetical protein BGO83_14810 [Devosia sp. 66-14]